MEEESELYEECFAICERGVNGPKVYKLYLYQPPYSNTQRFIKVWASGGESDWTDDVEYWAYTLNDLEDLCPEYFI